MPTEEEKETAASAHSKAATAAEPQPHLSVHHVRFQPQAGDNSHDDADGDRELSRVHGTELDEELNGTEEEGFQPPPQRQRRSRAKSHDTWREWQPSMCLPSFKETRTNADGSTGTQQKGEDTAPRRRYPVLSMDRLDSGDVVTGDDGGQLILWRSSNNAEAPEARGVYRCTYGWHSKRPGEPDPVTALESSAKSRHSSQPPLNSWATVRSSMGDDNKGNGSQNTSGGGGGGGDMLVAGCASGTIHVLRRTAMDGGGGGDWAHVLRIDDENDCVGKVTSLALVRDKFIVAGFLSGDLVQFSRRTASIAVYSDENYIEAARRLVNGLKTASVRRATIGDSGRETAIDTETGGALRDEDMDLISKKEQKVIRTKFLDSPWNWAWGVEETDRGSYHHRTPNGTSLLHDHFGSSGNVLKLLESSTEARSYHAAAALVEDIARNADEIYPMDEILNAEDDEFQIPERVAVTRCREFPTAVAEVLSTASSKALQKRKDVVNQHARIVTFEVDIDGELAAEQLHSAKQTGALIECDILSDALLEDEGLPCCLLPGDRIATYGGKGVNSCGIISITPMNRVRKRVDLTFHYSFDDFDDLVHIPVSLAVLPDGRRLAAGYQDGKIRIHDSGAAQSRLAEEKSAFFIGDKVTRRTRRGAEGGDIASPPLQEIGVVVSPNWYSTVRVIWNSEVRQIQTGIRTSEKDLDSDFEEEIEVNEIEHYDSTPSIKTVVLRGCKSPQHILCALQGGRRLMSASRLNDGEFFIWDHLASSNNSSRFVLPAISGLTGSGRTGAFSEGEVMISMKEVLRGSDPNVLKQLDHLSREAMSPMKQRDSKEKREFRRMRSSEYGSSKIAFSWSKIIRKTRKRGFVQETIHKGGEEMYIVKIDDPKYPEEICVKWHHLHGVRINDIEYLRDGPKNGSFVVALESGCVRMYDMEFYALNIFNLFDFGARQAAAPEIELAIKHFLQNDRFGGDQRVSAYLFEMTTVLWASVQQIESNASNAQALFLNHMGKVCNAFEFVLKDITDRTRHDTILKEISSYVMLMSEDGKFLKWIAESGIAIDAFSAMASTAIWRSIIRGKSFSLLIVFYCEFFAYLLLLFGCIYTGTGLRLRPNFFEKTPFDGKEELILERVCIVGLILAFLFGFREVLHAWNVRNHEINWFQQHKLDESKRSHSKALAPEDAPLVESVISKIEAVVFKGIFLRLIGAPFAATYFGVRRCLGEDSGSSFGESMNAFLERGDALIEPGIIKMLVKALSSLIVVIYVIFLLAPLLLLLSPIPPKRRGFRDREKKRPGRGLPTYLLHSSWWTLNVWTWLEEHVSAVVDHDLVTFLGFAKLYRTNLENLLDIFIVAFPAYVFGSYTFSERKSLDFGGGERIRLQHQYLCSFGVLVMSSKLFWYLKNVNLAFSGSVRMLTRTYRDLWEFGVLILVFLWMFLHILYLRGRESTWSEYDGVRSTIKTCNSSTMTILAPVALLSQECYAHSLSS